MFKASVSIMTVTLLLLSSTGCSGKQHLSKNGFETGLATKKSIAETDIVCCVEAPPPPNKKYTKTNVEIKMATEKSSIEPQLSPRDKAREECSSRRDDYNSNDSQSKRNEKQRNLELERNLCMEQRGFMW